MARFLHAQDRRVIATDIDSTRTKEAAELEALGIKTQIGFHDQATFDNASVIIPSPGIPLTVSYIQNAAAKGVKITGELDIFSRYNTTPVIAVTGTNGKTTTTTLIGKMTQASGQTCFVGGNIGTPLVDYLMTDQKADLVVAEISSYQLDLAAEFSPRVALLLNLSEDHLDRYTDYLAYMDSKWGIFKNQTASDLAIVNQSMEGCSARTSRIKSRVQAFSSQTSVATGAEITKNEIRITTQQTTDFIDTKDLPGLPGLHNSENIAAAALAVLESGGNMSGIRSALAVFAPLDHRIAFVRELNGIQFYNDSKATNVDAVSRAITSFDADILLILGGREKDTDFNELVASIKPKVKGIMAIGEATDHICEIFGELTTVKPCRDMVHAVNLAYTTGTRGDIVLLSPACASFDMYANYGERGQDFITQVNALKAPGKEAVHG